MPRHIIDTESSRPAYLRRRLATFVLIGLGLAVVAWLAWSHFGPAPGNWPH